jgi:hypothetical protein
MTSPASSHADHDGGYVVRRPRATDAIGQALLASFRPAALPEDMQRLVDRLDRTQQFVDGLDRNQRRGWC